MSSVLRWLRLYVMPLCHMKRIFEILLHNNLYEGYVYIHIWPHKNPPLCSMMFLWKEGIDFIFTGTNWICKAWFLILVLVCTKTKLAYLTSSAYRHRCEIVGDLWSQVKEILVGGKFFLFQHRTWAFNASNINIRWCNSHRGCTTKRRVDAGVRNRYASLCDWLQKKTQEKPVFVCQITVTMFTGSDIAVS